MNRADRTQVALAAVASVALRLPWLLRPLTSDEAGALVAAHTWGSGGRLYTDVFIDRPQGFLLPYRLIDAVAPHSSAAVRMVALVAGVVAVVGTAAAAQAISGRGTPAAAAAWVAAIVSASPAIEGYGANGELLAAALAVPAVALAAEVVERRRPTWWMVAAGALAGSALTVKQSGGDVAVAVLGWCVLAAWRRWLPKGQAARCAGWFALGLAAPIALAAIHGATLGWAPYTYALFRFRLHARSAVAGPQATRLAATLLVALPLFGPPAWVAIRRVRAHPTPLRSRLRPAHALALCWAAAAVAAFAAGGNFHRHYWIQLAFPAAAVLGLALASTPGPGEQPPSWATCRPVLVRALVIPLLASLVLVAAPRLEQDPRLERDRAVLSWVDRHRPPEARDLQPLCAEVTYTVDAHQPLRYPYLWVDHVRAAQGARRRLLALLDGPDRPSMVALFQPLQRCDPTGEVAAALAAHYRRVATVDGVPLYGARPSHPS